MSKLRLGTVITTVIATVFGGACFTGSSTPPAKPIVASAGSAAVVAAPTAIVISTNAIGSVDAKTPATLEGLREKLQGYEVKTSNDGVNGAEGFLHFDVFKDGERMFYVVPDDGLVFNVHATSPKITIDNHPTWKIGSPFFDAKQLSECDCWGEAIVCWKTGETVAAAFERTCKGMTGKDSAVALKVLDGVNLQRVVWAPKPFAGDEDPTPSIDMKRPGGGGLGGTVKGIPTRPQRPDPDDDDDDDDDD